MNASTIRFQTLASQARRAVAATDFDAIDPKALVRVLWRRRWLVAGVPLLLFVVIWAGMLRVTPTYTVYAKLMLDLRKVQMLGANDVVADVNPSEQIVNTEIAVLRSNRVIEKMLDGLPQAERDQLDPALRPVSLPGRLKGAVKRLLRGAPPPLSPEEAAAADRARVVDAVQGMRTAYAEPDSFVMTLRVDNSDPRLARDVVNGLADAYIALQRETRRAAVGEATDFLEARLGELKNQVEAAERAVARYQSEKLIEEGGTLETVSQQLASVNAELGAARAARIDAGARLKQLEDAVASEDYASAAHVVDTPNMQALAAQQLDLMQQDAVWARTFDEKNARRVEIRRKLAEIASAMRVEFENAIAVQRSALDAARTREAGLAESVKGLEARVLQMTDSQLGLRQLTREAEASRQTYESFLARVTEARAQRELQQADSVVVEHAALPEVPSKPRPMLLATLGGMAALAGMAAWVLFAEMSPTTFRAARELEGLGLPVLAALPLEKWQDMGEMLDELELDPYTTYAERIRQLRATLSLEKTAGGHGQSVMFLASAPGEGKTTTALALTKLISLSGSRAIIVDCDLRRPKVLPALDVIEEGGHDFSDFIARKCSLEEAIYQPDDHLFDVLGARQRSQQAADGLATSWLGPVLRDLEQRYDFVIIDSPALLAVPDALVIAPEVGTCFYVVECNRTPRAAVTRGLAMLADARVGLRGMILNKVSPGNAPAGTMEKEYGYGY